MSHQVILRHATSASVLSQERVQAQVEWIIERSLRGSLGSGWGISKLDYRDPVRTTQGWSFIYFVTLKTSRNLSEATTAAKMEQIKDRVAEAGTNPKFLGANWSLITESQAAAEAVIPAEPATSQDGGQLVLGTGPVLTWGDIDIPDELLGPSSDEALANHPCFRDLYGLNAQIRTALTGIKSAAETNGKRRGHFVFHGRPACGKTSVMLAIEKMLGEGSVLRLDATSTSRAGLEKLFFDNSEDGVKQIPPLVFCEEIEKAREDWLQVWLGALDDRGEIRKVNYRMSQVRQIEILFFCSVNNKVAFDSMMSHNPSAKERGALSSRCVNQIYFPRPTKETIKRILHRDIIANGGSDTWIEPAMKLAEELGTDDPREALAFLAGGNRLLTGEYQKDE